MNNNNNKNNKKIKYVKIDDRHPLSAPKKRKKSGKLTAGKAVVKSLSVVGTTLVCMLLIVIITVCIVATGLTVYVMQFADNSFDVSLEDVELGFSTFLYAYDNDGNEVTVKQLSTDENRVWVDIEDIPQHVIDAFVSVEDEDFFDHDGVDWSRTVWVALKAVFSNGTQGGSTITQQLVRDITGDKETTAGRKLREIFRALALEQKYTKNDIIESYLNRIAFGGTSYGIASASLRYYDKSPSELTVAEAALLAGIVRSPSTMNPYASLTKARDRQMYALEHMYDNGYLTTEEFDKAVAEQVKFRLPVLGDDFGYVDERYNEYYGIQDVSAEEEDLYYENETWEQVSDTTEAYTWNGTYEVTQNWYVDAAINQVSADLADLKGITVETARTLLYSGGYSVYLNMDMNMQDTVSRLFEDPYTCLSSYELLADRDDLIQASFVIMDYTGNVLAIAGGLGEKEGDNCFNRATQAKQVVGSTIKPLSVYSLGIENNVITYSTMIRDISGKIPAGALGQEEDYFTDYNGYNEEDDTIRWPHNYQDLTFGTGKYYPAWYAVQESMNTIAVNVLSRIGILNSYTQLTTKLGFDTLDSVNDMAFSPLALGAFTNGVPLVNLAAAYAIVGNGGLYYEPYFYSRVLDSEGRTVLMQNSVGDRAISEDSAWITNRMMRTVITNSGGTGQNAALENIEVIGKTGTANDMSALLFCGLTPSYIGAYRISHDDNTELTKGSGYRTLAVVWHTVFSEICDTEVPESFTPCSDVIVANYCTETGLIASADCPSTKVGYYRQSNIPQTCRSDHDGTYWPEPAEDESDIPFYG